MQLKLQQLRKAAGYKSRDDFAAVLGINPRTYKTWETGERNLSFVQAVMIADVLQCSLDELAGRYEYIGSYADQRQVLLNQDFAKLDDSDKDAAYAAVRGMAAMCAQESAGARAPDSKVS